MGEEGEEVWTDGESGREKLQNTASGEREKEVWSKQKEEWKTWRHQSYIKIDVNLRPLPHSLTAATFTPSVHTPHRALTRRRLETMTQTHMLASWLGLISHYLSFPDWSRPDHMTLSWMKTFISFDYQIKRCCRVKRVSFKSLHPECSKPLTPDRSVRVKDTSGFHPLMWVCWTVKLFEVWLDYFRDSFFGPQSKVSSLFWSTNSYWDLKQRHRRSWNQFRWKNDISS